MSEPIRRQLIDTLIDKVNALVDAPDDINKQYEFKEQKIRDDESLTEDEKKVAINLLIGVHDRHKIRSNNGTKRHCESCLQECFATSYCELCIRTYLKNNFSNWTSGSDDIDDLIQGCQVESLQPCKIIEWIPYDNLRNVEYKTKGGYSEIYKAIWIDGPYYEWDSEEKQLKRYGPCEVILKKLEVESAKRSWFDEVYSLLYFCSVNELLANVI
jgi:hypothetical protein